MGRERKVQTVTRSRFAVLAIALFGANLVHAATFTTDSTIAASDITYENQDVTVDGATLTIDGVHSFTNLSLINGAKVTHSESAAIKLELTVGTVSIDASSSIDLTAKGHFLNELTTGRAGGSHGGRGGVGDQGGDSNLRYGDYRMPVDYGTGGATTHTIGIGSRGGGAIKLVADELIVDGYLQANGQSGPNNYTGGGAGGSVWLDVGTLSGSGWIRANGGSGKYTGTGGGGGGRVAISYATLNGFPIDTRVLASGGLWYTSNGQSGAPGTVYLKDKAAALGQIIIDNSSTGPNSRPFVLANDLPEPLTVKNTTLHLADGVTVTAITGNGNTTVVPLGTFAMPNNALIVDAYTLIVNTPQNWDEVKVINGGRIAHELPETVPGARVDFTARRIEIGSGAYIDVSGQGYLAHELTTGRTGGSHGGRGGRGDQSGDSNLTYGNYRLPVDYGTGGATTHANGVGNRGGGAIKLVAEELIVDGYIQANGLAGPNNYTGGGAGGSVLIDVGTLSGSGWIRTNGGSGKYTGSGGGGGGRVAIYYDTLNGFLLDTRALASGGSRYTNNGENGVPGTVYVRDKAQSLGTLRFDNTGPGATYTRALELPNGISEPVTVKNAYFVINDPLTLSTLTVVNSTVEQNGALIVDDLSFSGGTWQQDGALTVNNSYSGSTTKFTHSGAWSLPTGNDMVVDGWTLIVNGPQTWNLLQILNGGKLTTALNADDTPNALTINATRVEVASGSYIDVSNLGNLASAEVTGHSGGSYGGLGGTGNQGGTTNPVFGDPSAPVKFGTGGATEHTSDLGSRGGGALKLVSDELIADGFIHAYGQSGPNNYTGGGSGGSIWLDVGVLSGTGWIRANGGNGNYTGTGGGGGGRVAIYYGRSEGFDLVNRITVNGGSRYGAGSDGQPGTIHTGERTDPVVITSTTPAGWTNQPVNQIAVAFLAPIDAASFTVDDVTLNGPSGAITPTAVTSIDPLNFTIDFAAPLAEGAYTLAIGTNLTTVGGLGMDQDRDGLLDEAVDDVYTSAFAIDFAAPNAPVVTSHPLAPEVTHLTSTTVAIAGTRDADTAIWVNDQQKIALGSDNWSTQVTLQDGNNTVTLVAKDAAGNVSSPVTLQFYVDSTAPRIDAMSPANGTLTNNRPAQIFITFTESGSGLDLNASTLTVTRTGTSIVGTWQELENQLVFTPSSVFTEGVYETNVRLVDNAGLESSSFVASFTLDQSAPAAPVLDDIPTVTSINQIAVSGSKEAYAAVYLAGTQVIGATSATTWSYNAPLAEGDNTLSFTLVDRAGNVSAPASATIRFDNTAPGAVLVLANGNGNGTTIELSWTGYDEVTNGNDIDHYLVLMSTTAFAQPSGATTIATVPGGTKGYTVTGLERATGYFFAVLAKDTLGNALTTVTPVAVRTADVVAPLNVTDLTITSLDTQLTVSWAHTLDVDNDLSGYSVYVNNDAGRAVAKTNNSLALTGLTPATAYAIRVTSVDADGNESNGISITGVTRLNNPVLQSAEPLNGMVELTWPPVQPSQYVKHYAIYASPTDFTSVAGLSPRLTVAGSTNTARLAGLANGTTYYIAVTTVNSSDGERDAVATLSATPQADQSGPTLTNLIYAGAPLISGSTLTTTDAVTLTATDPTGVSRVELTVDGTLVATDTNGSTSYRLPLNLDNLTDSAHTLSITAYDTLDNTTELTLAVQVAMAPPPAPTITTPANGDQTSQTRLNLSGSAAAGSEVFVYNNTAQVAGPLSIDNSGRFSTAVTLNDGDNSLQAAAQNRGGLGNLSPAVVVTLDTSIPTAPFGTAAEAREAGQVRVSWSQPNDSAITGYDVYRANQPFVTITEATKLNSQPLVGGVFDDLPAADGTYYYRVSAVNTVGTPSALSNQATALIDSTPPRALAIDYMPSGNVDDLSGRIAPGRVAVSVIVSEPLLTEPFLSITPNGGIPLSVQLTRVTDTEYQGAFDITPSTPTGMAYAVFSARDKVGNRGTEVDRGATLLIDAAGPRVTQLTLNPADPIRNDELAPVTVTVDLQLDQALKSATLPALSTLLSGVGRTETPVDAITQTGADTWQAQFTLPADAGLAGAESLRFVFSAVDDLDNTGTRIDGSNLFQVYQGDLPPLAAPFGLTATALPGGQVHINWREVSDAADYQLFRQAPGETALTAYQRSSGAPTFTDNTTGDGTYRYAVASVRSANGQESVSGQSDPVEVIADATLPGVPTNVTIELVGAGMQLTWDALGAESGELTYNVYRSGATTITTVDGLTPRQTNIVTNQQGLLGYIDPAPKV